MTAVVHGPTAAVEGWSRVSGARPVDGGAAVPGGVRHRPQSVRDYVPGARARSPMIGGRPLDGAAAAAGFADQSHLNRLFRGRVREDADRVVGPGAVQDVDGVHGRMVDHMGADAVLVRPDFVLYAPPSCSPAWRPGTVARVRGAGPGRCPTRGPRARTRRGSSDRGAGRAREQDFPTRLSEDAGPVGAVHRFRWGGPPHTTARPSASRARRPGDRPDPPAHAAAGMAHQWCTPHPVHRMKATTTRPGRRRPQRLPGRASGGALAGARTAPRDLRGLDTQAPRAPDLQEHRDDAVSEGRHATYAHGWRRNVRARYSTAAASR
jgi:hypothetical protein